MTPSLLPPHTTRTAIDEYVGAEQATKAARALLALSIAARRTALDLSQSQLGRLARVDRADISRLERRNGRCPISVARAIDATLTRIEQERSARPLAVAS